MHRCISQQSVSNDKSYYYHYWPSADCLKTADDQGRLYPVNQKGAGKRVQTATHTYGV